MAISFKSIWLVSMKGIIKTQTVVLILLLVGFLLPAWHMSGTIEQLVAIALQLITAEHFYLFTFLIALVFSMMLGTSVGTLSAVGIPIMSSALALNISPEIVAGALISGAFVGDRTSPFSSAHQLLAHTVELPVKKQLRSLFMTTLIAVILGSIFYYVCDLQANIPQVAQAEFTWGSLSLITFLPPLILIVAVLLRVKIVYAFLASIIAACMLAVGNGISVTMLSNALLYGVDGMGGFVNMYLLLLFLMLAGAYNGLLEEYQVIQPLLDNWLQSSKSLIADTLKTIAATLGISMITANQTLPLILTGRTFLPHWQRKHSGEALARVMADSTMLFPGMVPWSVLAIMCSTIVGVPLLHYLPYAIFLWALPFITVCVSIIMHFYHVRQSKVMREQKEPSSIHPI